MKNSVLLDITNVACEWFTFLDDLGISGYDYELAVSIYNREYDDVGLFFEDMSRKGLLHSDLVDDKQYLYDYIYENVEELLIDPIHSIIGNRLLINVKVFTIKGKPSTVFGIFI